MAKKAWKRRSEDVYVVQWDKNGRVVPRPLNRKKPIYEGNVFISSLADRSPGLGMANNSADHEDLHHEIYDYFRDRLKSGVTMRFESKVVVGKKKIKNKNGEYYTVDDYRIPDLVFYRKHGKPGQYVVGTIEVCWKKDIKKDQDKTKVIRKVAKHKNLEAFVIDFENRLIKQRQANGRWVPVDKIKMNCVVGALKITKP